MTRKPSGISRAEKQYADKSRYQIHCSFERKTIPWPVYLSTENPFSMYLRISQERLRLKTLRDKHSFIGTPRPSVTNFNPISKICLTVYNFHLPENFNLSSD